MRGEVELQNKVFQHKLVLWNLEFFGIVLYPLTQLDGPTTSDIVRNLDAFDLLVFQGR